MKLTPHQREHYDNIITFLSSHIDSELESSYIALLHGAAGTGKTSLMKKLVVYIRNTLRKTVAGVAPTHRARKVLHGMINERAFLKIPTMTLGLK